MRVSVRALLFFLIILWCGVGFSVPFAFTYAGRLLDGSGNPLSGSQSVQITFWDAQTGGSQLAENLQASPASNDTYTVNVVNGVFSQVINLSAANFHTVFPDSTTGTWVQVEAAGITYPRQQFTAVPYALKVPVDGSTIGYNSSGQLELKTLSSSQLPSVITSSSDATFNSVKVGRGASSVETNSAVGLNALYSNTTGAQNTALGYGGLYANTTGTGNTGLGYASLNQNTTGLSNTAVGRSALHLNLTGSYNTAMGYYALYENTTGVQNSAFGHGALQNNNANNNTAVGLLSLQSNTSGTQNVGVGALSLQLNTTGSNNTAMGYRACYANTTGTGNTGVGMYSLTSTTTGNNNTALGMESLLSNLTGYQNTAIGRSALRTTTTGVGNTVVGYNAGHSISTGNNNSGLGASALESTTTGALNVAIGYEALKNNTTGSSNVVVGYGAGKNLTTGNNNTIIGEHPGEAGLNNTVIISAGSTERMRIDSSGNVGIGTNSPLAGLHNNKDSFKPTSLEYEKIIQLSFAHGVANQKAKLEWNTETPSLWGWIEIEATSYYWHQNAAGKIKKIYSIGANGGTTYLNTSNYTEVSGNTAANWALGELTWDSSTSKWHIPIVHRNSNGNIITLRVRVHASAPYYIAALQDFSLGSVYTTDTAIYPTPVVSVPSQLEVGGPIKLGGSSSTCNATTEGQQRYNSTSKNMEFCNGTAWTSFSSQLGTTCVWRGPFGKAATNWLSGNQGYCASGEYMNGFDFYHPGGQNLTYQEYYRIYCCK